MFYSLDLSLFYLIYVCVKKIIICNYSYSLDAYKPKRKYDPDMHNMMTSLSGGENNQRPSVFGDGWGFFIHNPNSYLQQYREYKHVNIGDNLVNNQASTAMKMKTMKNYNMYGLSSVEQKSAANTNMYIFNPNTLNQQLMHDSQNSNYDMLKDYMQTNIVHQTNQAHKEDIKPNSDTEHTELSRQGTRTKNKAISNINSMPKDKTDKQLDNASNGNSKSSHEAINRFDAAQLNNQMMKTMFSPNSLNGNTNGLLKHGSVNELADKSKQSSRHGTFHFDAKNLNSEMLHNVGYNPVYVNAATGLNRNHKRRSSDFNPNTIMSKYMELRTNGNLFGSYHPNDLLNEITSFSTENENSKTPLEFDPNGHSMFPAAQHTDWGFSNYNPLHSLEQYSGRNDDKGSAGPSQEGFNPNKLNDHLMEMLKQKITESSKAQAQHIVNGFNPDTLNSKLFHSLGYKPGTVSMKTSVPIFHENIPQSVTTNSDNVTQRNGLPGIGTSDVFGETKSSTPSQNGYVKNTHSSYENKGTVYLSGVQPQQVTPTTSTNLHNNQGQTQITNSGAVIKNHNLKYGVKNQNSAQGVNSIFNENIISQTGATNTANAQATGVGSLSGSVQTKGNGYHQSMYQQGSTQGMINNTSVLTGAGGIVSQTHAGGLGSTTVQHTGIASGNGKGQDTVSLGSNTVSQTATDGLGSTSVGQTGSGSTGSNVITQTNAGGLGSNTVSQSAAGSLGSTRVGKIGSGSLGSNTVSKTNIGGLGDETVSQTATGSLGTNSVTQTNTGGLGSKTVQQPNAGAFDYSSASQTSNGSLGSNSAAQTGTGSLGTKTIQQTNGGSVGSHAITHTGVHGVGNLRNSGSVALLLGP